MCLVQRKIRQGRWKKQNEEKNGRDRYGNSYTKWTKNCWLLSESVTNRTICNVSSRKYFQYFSFKGLDNTRNIVFSFILLQIFFQCNIFRNLRMTVISSSQWSVVSTFWIIWGNVRCRLMKPLIFGDYTKIITRFILHF